MTTPDEARDMLDTARQEAGDGQRPVTVAANHAPLAEAAPALAQTVANMHYEYAVQVQMSDGEWHFTDDDYYPFGTPEPRLVQWETETGAKELYNSFVEDDGPEYLRIVRRLATEPEVVE